MKHFKSDYDGMSPKASRQACQLPPLPPDPCQANTNSAPSGGDANPAPCALSFKSGDGGPGALPPGLDLLGPAFVKAGLQRANPRPREGSASVCLHFPSHCPWAMSQRATLSSSSVCPPRLSSLLSRRYSSLWTGLCPPKFVSASYNPQCNCV